jgi:hypothetical protein
VLVEGAGDTCHHVFLPVVVLLRQHGANAVAALVCVQQER